MRLARWILLALALVLLAAARAGGGDDSGGCDAEARSARAAVRGLSRLPPLAFVREALASYSRSDGVCLSGYDAYHDAIGARAATWLSLTDASGQSLESHEVYVCINGLKGQRCDGIYADDTLCWCEKWPEVRLAASGLARVRVHPDFRARWFWARFERGGFKEYVPLKLTGGTFDARAVKLETPQVIFALLEPRVPSSGGVPLKLVWRVQR